MRPLSKHRQDAVIAAIDELTEEALEAGEQPGRVESCPHCRLEWHGLPFLGCPGSAEKPPAAGIRHAHVAAFHGGTFDGLELEFQLPTDRYTIEDFENMRGGFERNRDM